MNPILFSARLLPALAFLSLSACATAVPPVEVTRFHVDSIPRAGTVSVQQMANNDDLSLEFRTYARAVTHELQQIGFTPADTAPGDYVVNVGYSRDFRDPMVERRSPVSVGVGGSTGSYGSGLGVGIGIDLSGKPRGTVFTGLQVQIRRRSDSAVIWEGRAMTRARQGTPASQPGIAAAKLAAALFRDYPGQSGQTITVK